MAHYDPRGGIGPHVRRQVEALAAAVDDVVVVTTADLSDESRAWFGARSRLIERRNFGYDFFSYRTGVEASPLGQYDEVILCNDTYVPVADYRQVIATMADRPVDFWGLSRSDRVSPHVQSFFVAFRPWLVDSQAFRTFWGDMQPISDRWQVIKRYEVGMSTTLMDAGFAFASYFEADERDRHLGRRRVRWWAAHRTPLRGRADLALLRRRAAEPWNPSIGLADRALDGGRMPYVKIDTLRYDPYALRSDKLLSLGERAFPDAFDGVRAFLSKTTTFYPPRDEGMRPTPRALVPLRPTVEYRNDF
jgi:rhamnosyltransferase